MASISIFQMVVLVVFHRLQEIAITGMHFCLMCNTALNQCYCGDKIWDI